ncbi:MULTISPECIES: ABC transporter ATP-binding protein [unclassified Rhizobium]|uniref:ABC transporter ATP-binding protein n=1 Tax=unclassified Rhizobium TaxID=2613769 RepID=UPI0006910CA0|nr:MULTISPECIES: ABC transporter ATP-binding protein [unclassified Rhizobium]MBN8953403.1 ABC transporter ATP-binding protein [Rhizobium tropici]OJY74514.1 MAG: spermidine/putrescine ABC transporter ATP-binding protein [Rhizobium sp. 60-20]RKD67994.1 putative spermidine/putrescine transport system ATP-binding protein [Rhizobium sp. WW_1]
MMHQTIRGGGIEAIDDPYLSLRDINKRYGMVEVIPNLNLEVRKGELIALLGPSGCGKTTTLRMIAGLISPTSGTIAVGGRDVTHIAPHGRDMGLVFQSYALFPHMTVAGNVAFGLEMRGLPRAEIAAKVGKALDMVQLGHLSGRKPRELSGGQQQRVALARALVIEPSILLLDEPLSNLDAKLRDEMRAQIRDIQQALGITTVFVTHDQVEALSMCDRIVVMKGGFIEQVGTPHDIYEHPVTPFVASFVGRTNRIKGIGGQDGSIRIGSSTIRAAAPAQKGDVTVMVRPHRVHIDWDLAAAERQTHAANRIPAALFRITFVGDVIQYHFSIDGSEFIVEEATVRSQAGRRPGQTAMLSWSIEDTSVFGAGS